MHICKGIMKSSYRYIGFKILTKPQMRYVNSDELASQNFIFLFGKIGIKVPKLETILAECLDQYRVNTQ